MATVEDRSAAATVTTLMICSAVCALMMLALRAQAACFAVAANSAGLGRQSPFVAIGRGLVWQWHPLGLSQVDPGLAEVVWSLLPVLERRGLIPGGNEVLTQAGREPEYTVTPYGEWFLAMLTEPE